MHVQNAQIHTFSPSSLCSLLTRHSERSENQSKKRSIRVKKKNLISKLIINLTVESWFIFIFILMTFSFLFNDISYDDSSLKTVEFLSEECMSMHVCLCVHMHTCMYKTNLYSVTQIFRSSNVRCILRNSNTIRAPFHVPRKTRFPDPLTMDEISPIEAI